MTERPEPPPQLPEDGPTELAEGRDGELVERLSTGTATLLLAWLMGIGAASALLAAWVVGAVFFPLGGMIHFLLIAAIIVFLAGRFGRQS